MDIMFGVLLAGGVAYLVGKIVDDSFTRVRENARKERLAFKIMIDKELQKQKDIENNLEKYLK